jgi:hypothetical protein
MRWQSGWELVSWSNESVVGYSLSVRKLAENILGSVSRKRLMKTWKTLCVLQLQ